MNRIEYLINNPYKVEESDLNLLNTEIEKYPYFYSLRALKLIVLQNIDRTTFEDQLQITSVFSNSINLFHLVNHSNINEIRISKNQLTDDETISNVIEEQSIDVNDQVEDSFMNEIHQAENQLTDDEIISNVIEEQSIDVNDKVEDSFMNEIHQAENQLTDDETISNVIEEQSIDVNNQVEDSFMNEIHQAEFEEITSESIQKSIEITNEILQTNEFITQAIQETKEVLHTSEILTDIEQVDLINRSISSINLTQQVIPVVNTIPFFVLNKNNEVAREPLFEEIEDEISISVENLIEIPEQINFTESKPKVNLEKDSTLKQEENKSFSFNEWLKLPSSNLMNTQQEKEQKFQIIDDFLEKNPKITPLKKQDIPEYKNEVKNIKQTDFSDLMTETLAQIYIEQKQYEKAIKAYKILILKYPEKNSLFAKQIKEIENLKNSK